jgi:hypothetical protein
MDWGDSAPQRFQSVSMPIKKKTNRSYRLAVGKDGPTGDFAPLVEMHHVAHLNPGLAILRDRVVKAGRPAAGDRLKGVKQVCWFSPNQYGARGSHHGTVQFSFDFAELLRGRRIYWVGAVAERKQKTCRLLVTLKGRRPAGLKRYHPRLTKGPIRRVDGRWYRRMDVALEIMVEGDLPIAECTRVGAVPHGVGRCGRSCREIDRAATETAALLLAGSMRGRYRLPGNSYVQAGRASPLVHDGWFGLITALGLLEDGEPGGRTRGAGRVDFIVRSALGRLAKGDAAGAVDKISAIDGERRVRRSLKRLLQRSSGFELGPPYGTVIGLAAPTSSTDPARRQSERGAAGEARQTAPGRAAITRADGATR